jgi:DNA-binding NarL/FixJ family response regulator
MIRILLVEDHHIVRKGLETLLKQERDFDVIGEAVNGLEAVSFATKHKPDVVVLDINMPLLNGLQAAQQIFENSPKTRIIILSQYSERPMVRQAFRIGIHGYLLKESLAVELPLAIRTAYQGQTYISPTISGFLLDEIVHGKRIDDAKNPQNVLSDREYQIMQLIAEGHSTNDIAEILTLSPKTVGNHRTSLMNKLNVHSVAEVVRLAIKYGMVLLDP